MNEATEKSVGSIPAAYSSGIAAAPASSVRDRTTKPLPREMVVVRELDCCESCGRAPYIRRDGTTYLYRYRMHGPVVCSPRCNSRCDCQAPNAPGVAMKSNGCRVHS